jgi:hypothetical protein
VSVPARLPLKSGPGALKMLVRLFSSASAVIAFGSCQVVFIGADVNMPVGAKVKSDKNPDGVSDLC